MPPSTRSPQPAKAVLALQDKRQSDLARAIGKSEHYVGRVLNGRERPSAEVAEAISGYLDVPVDDLFVDDDVDVVARFVQRTTSASGVPEHVEDQAAAEKIAQVLR